MRLQFVSLHAHTLKKNKNGESLAQAEIIWNVFFKSSTHTGLDYVKKKLCDQYIMLGPI